MSNYLALNLRDILTDIHLGEKKAKELLTQFLCPLNLSVEHFLKNSAIEFSKQNISSTYLIMTTNQNENILVGYFTLAIATLELPKDTIPSQTWLRRLSKFGYYNTIIQRHIISAPLIAQLGKNYTNSYNNLITGDELLQMALDKVHEVQSIIGGKLVYLECENNPKLIDFYSDNGFVNFGPNRTDYDELDNAPTKSLILMLKYLR